MAYNGPISASDPLAIEKLTDKLTDCKVLQEHMKAVNAYYRKHDTCKGYPEMSDSVAYQLDMKVEAAYSWDKQPYPSWALSNNNAVIKAVEKRIAEITRNTEIGFSGWEFARGEVIANTDINRLQLIFHEKPGEQQRAQLKSNGFKWSPREGAWQRQLNDNAIYAAGRLDFVKPADGRSVRDHQPKTPERENLTR